MDYVLLAPIGSGLALLFAVFLALKVLRAPEGNEKMKKISGFIRSGANAYLKRQYGVVAVFFGIMTVVLGIMAYFGFVTPFVPFAFLNKRDNTRSGKTNTLTIARLQR